MTASEKAFVAEISALVFANPEIRDGNRFLDRNTFATLPKFAQQRYIYLLATKSR